MLPQQLCAQYLRVYGAQQRTERCYTYDGASFGAWIRLGTTCCPYTTIVQSKEASSIAEHLLRGKAEQKTFYVDY